MIQERHPLTRDMLLAYFEKAFTPREQWLVGMEFERMGVDAATGRRIPYDGRDASVRACLELIHRLRGGDPVYEGDNLIGLDAAWGTISLEPGGQVEWSSMPYPGLARLTDELEAHLRVLDEVSAKLGIRWLDEAMDPDTPLTEVPWMPKARYTILRRFLGERGRLAHRMMTQTASIQCAFDFADACDWARKFRAAALVTPVALALFANSSHADGADTGFRSFRQAIWRETDPARCGLPRVVFEPGFGLEPWLDYVLETPAIFLNRVRGLVPAGAVPFGKLLERPGCGAVTWKDWELHLSAIFTEVRSYSYIEVRCADLQPASTIMAVPAFWTGLLYHEDSLLGALELCRGHDRHESWSEAMASAARLGLDGSAGGRPIRDLAREAIDLARRGLASVPAAGGEPERAFAPLVTLAERLGLEPGPR